MRTADTIEQLRAELLQDLQFIQKNYQKNRHMTERILKSGSDDEFDLVALGYTLQNLYSACESYFFRIAKFFENNLEKTAWQSSLLHRMTLDIQGVRPAVISIEFSSKLDELLRFRHVFRNLYKTPLIPQKVHFANSYVEGLTKEFIIFHDRFDAFLLEPKGHLGNA